MVPKEGDNPSESAPRYVWDPDKLAWVEAKPTAAKEAEIAPAEEVVAGPTPAQEIPVEEALAEGLVVEAAPEIEELEQKGVWIRVGGVVVDLIVLSILDLAIHYTIGRVVDLPTYIVLLYGFIYFVGFWSWRGQTPGKMLIGAKIVRTNGTRLDIGRAILRYPCYFVPIYTPIVLLAAQVNVLLTIVVPLLGLAVMALNRQKKGIHDFVAGTCVVNTRIRAPLPEEVESAEPEQTDESGADTSEQV